MQSRPINYDCRTKPRLGHLRLSALTKVVVDDWHRKMEDAFRAGLFATNPTKRSALPKARAKEMTCWSVDQARAFLKHVAGDPVRGALAARARQRRAAR